MARAWADAGRHYAELDPTAFREPDGDGLVEYFARCIAEPRSEGEIVLVAEADSDVIGFISARLAPADPDARFELMRELAAPRVRIEALAVSEPARGRGVGKALVSAVQDWARSAGAAVAIVNTPLGAPLSLPFYEALGYHRHAVSFRRDLS
jgi:GNAT superfamily N-acetyltransferase